jgi:hypothetical protein
MRHTLSLLAKAAISILLLYFSLHSIDLGALGARLNRLDSGWVVLALFLLMVQVVLLTVRWRDISTACGANLPFTLALQISFIATFFNQVLPSTVGGDSARIWLLARKGAGWARATYSVLIDRIAGVFVLAVIVIACLPFTFSLIHDPIARGPAGDRRRRNDRYTGIRADRPALSALVRSMEAHAALGRRITDQCDTVRLPPRRRDRLGVLGRNQSDHCRRSVVLRQSDRFTGQFCANSVPHAAGAFDRDFADIDCRLGCP